MLHALLRCTYSFNLHAKFLEKDMEEIIDDTHSIGTTFPLEAHPFCLEWMPDGQGR